MRKDIIRAGVAAAILLMIYHLVVFIVPFVHTPTFWVSYIFGLAAFAVLGASIYIAFIQNPDAKSKFYGFPIARIGVIHGGGQLILSLVVMALAAWIPCWIPIVVFGIGLGAAVIGLASVEAVVDEIQTMDAKLKKDVSLMRNLQSKVSQLAVQSDNPALTALAEEFRFSDPVSSEAIAYAEADLAAAVDQLQAAFVDGDKEAVTQLCHRTTALLTERNRLCKLNKQ